ncbi:MAG: hypothetical protein RL077_775 [Verrucomicrobiota bacterium]
MGGHREGAPPERITDHYAHLAGPARVRLLRLVDREVAALIFSSRKAAWKCGYFDSSIAR